MSAEREPENWGDIWATAQVPAPREYDWPEWYLCLLSLEERAVTLRGQKPAFHLTYEVFVGGSWKVALGDGDDEHGSNAGNAPRCTPDTAY